MPKMLKLPTRESLLSQPINTQRLTLTPMDETDCSELLIAIQESHNELVKWLPWVPFVSDELSERRFVLGCISDWDAGRAIRLVIRAHQSRAVLGVVSLEECNRLHQRCSLGYWLRTSAQGQGIMTEAASGLVHLAFTQYHAHRVEVAAATDNHRSLAVIHRLGFRFEGIARQAEFCNHRWLDHAKFSLIISDLLR